MNIGYRFIVPILFILFALVACGGGGGGGGSNGTVGAVGTGGSNTPLADTIAPVITLNGSNPIAISQNSVFTDPGATVTDNIDTGLVATVTGSVNTSVIGSYTLTYNASDRSGNAAIPVHRIINVNAPAALATPTLTATVLSSNSIRLNWTAVSGATGYRVWQDTPSNNGVVKILVVDTTSTTYNVLQLGVNTSYTFYVDAYSSTGGGSALSTAASATTLTTVPIPAVPTGLATTAGFTQINLSWTAVPAATSYTVAKFGYTGPIPVATVTSTNYVDSGLPSGSLQIYYVRANNTSGSSAYSSSVLDTTLTLTIGGCLFCNGTVPPAPTNVVATMVNPGSVMVTWDLVAGAVSYNVYNAQGSNTVTVAASNKLGNTAASSLLNNGLVAGTPYSYIVTALNAHGESAASATLNFTIPVGSLAAPTIRVTHKPFADSYGKVYYQDYIEVTAPANSTLWNVYFRMNPLTDPYPIYALDINNVLNLNVTPPINSVINSIPYLSPTQYVLPTGNIALLEPDPNNVGLSWLAVDPLNYPSQRHFVMTTVDSTGRESAFSQEWSFNWW